MFVQTVSMLLATDRECRNYCWLVTYYEGCWCIQQLIIIERTLNTMIIFVFTTKLIYLGTTCIKFNIHAI